MATFYDQLWFEIFRKAIFDSLIDTKNNPYYILHSRLADPDPKIINEIKSSIVGKSSERILITGHAGSGKSVLLGQVHQKLGKWEDKILTIDVRSINSSIKNESLTLQDIQDKILLIDGLDEATYGDYEYLKWLISNCKLCIATSRVSISKDNLPYISWFNSTIDVEKYNSIRESINNRFYSRYSIDERISTESIIIFQSLIRQLKNKKKLEESLEKTVQLYDESGQILLYNPSVEIPNKEIVLPSKEIITGVNVLQTSLVEAVQRNSDLIYEMSPRQFEEFVAEMYERQGYKVELTKMTRDGGKDLILYADGPTGHNMFYVECKKYRKSHLVDVGIVRNFYGVVEADKATAGILVTSSLFTPDARSFEKQVFHRMTLVDYIDLLNQVTSIRG